MIKIRLKGGSLSGTYLIEEDGFSFVRKEVSLSINREYGFQRWYSQLKKMQRYSVLFPGIFPKILKYGHVNDLAYFDMEYLKDFVTGFEFLKSTNDYVKIVSFFNSLVVLMQKMHQVKIESNQEAILFYIEEEVNKKIADCYANVAFSNFLKHDYALFNGQQIPSFITQLEKFKQQMFDLYQNQKETFTHGNLTLENILYNPEQNKMIFIDPYEENIIDSSLCDCSQILQSCSSKYEILNDTTPIIKDNSVDVDIFKFEGLEIFHNMFNKYLCANYGENQYKLIKLFEISQYLRMLPFKMVVDENKMILFYTLASKLFFDIQDGNAKLDN